MESAIVVRDSPVRSIAIRPATSASQKKQASYVLVLEELHSSESSLSRSNSISRPTPDKRKTKSLNCTAKFQPLSKFDGKKYSLLVRTPIYGCLGLVQVDGEPFICVISACSPVGEIEKSMIYRLDNVLFFSLTNSKYDTLTEDGSSFIQLRETTITYQASAGLESPQDQYETVRHPCQHLQRFLASGTFYFSYDFDLTRGAQVRMQSNEEGSFWELGDNRFFWNHYMLKELLKFRKQLPEQDQTQLDQEGILVMATSGFVRIDDVQQRGENVKCAIISRLSCMRAGTRFNTRGIDDDGNVANNVETEMLVYVNDLCYSNTIVRGSVPLFWEQQGIQLGKHTIQITRSAAAAQPAVERHFRDLIKLYGKQHVVNLLGQKEGSAELILSDAFNQHVRKLETGDFVKMANFDFHAAVKGSQYENLEVLVNQLRGSIKEFGYFLANTKTKQTISTQQGTFRVNCLDCLDRTNVVQGLLCKNTLQPFIATALKTSAENLFSICFSDIWADNGDEISRIYTGTGALKSGFTRTGKRTIAGLMDDAKKSATRFYMNNFQDKSKQEVIDLLLGNLANQNVIRLHNPIREAVTKELNTRLSEFASSTVASIHCATWNVNGKQPLGENLAAWLTFNGQKLPEIFVVSFQEIVELSPQQIMATDSSKRLVWEDLLLKSINSLSSHSYVLVQSGQLVGAALTVFIRSDFAPHTRNVEMAIKKTGLAGLAGNKGGVAIRMDIHDTTLCFVCAHLAAGHSNVDERNQDYATISEGLLFKKGRKIYDHEVIIWLGDFNYRIDLSNDEVRSRVTKNELEYLTGYDQLINQMKAGKAFQGLSEGPLKFAPTYKYDNGTNNYDSSDKMRIPAWTDRVIFSGPALKQLVYERAELVSSDHKPVKSLFEVQLRVVNKEVKEKIQQELYRKYMEIGVESNETSPSTLVIPPLYAKSSTQSNVLIDLGDNSASAPTIKPSSIASTAVTSKQAPINWWDDDASELSKAFQTNSISPAPTRTFAAANTSSPALPPRQANATVGGSQGTVSTSSFPSNPNLTASGTNSMNRSLSAVPPIPLMSTVAPPLPDRSRSAVNVPSGLTSIVQSQNTHLETSFFNMTNNTAPPVQRFNMGPQAQNPISYGAPRSNRPPVPVMAPTNAVHLSQGVPQNRNPFSDQFAVPQNQNRST